MTLEPDKIQVGPKSSVIVVVLTLILGAGAAVLALLAMISANQNPPTSIYANVSEELNCNYQTSTATTFGIIAGIVLATAMSIISVLGGCVCCVTMTYAYGNALRISIVCYTLAWSCFFLAELCVMTGGYINQYHYGTTNYQWDIQLRTCYHTKASTYLIGAICSLATVLFAVLYYGQAQKSKYEAWVEQGAPTPRLYSLETMKSFVIAGPARTGPLKSEDVEEEEEEGAVEDVMDDYDDFDETESLSAPLHPSK